MLANSTHESSRMIIGKKQIHERQRSVKTSIAVRSRAVCSLQEQHFETIARNFKWHNCLPVLVLIVVILVGVIDLFAGHVFRQGVSCTSEAATARRGSEQPSPLPTPRGDLNRSGARPLDRSRNHVTSAGRGRVLARPTVGSLVGRAPRLSPGRRCVGSGGRTSGRTGHTPSLTFPQKAN